MTVNEAYKILKDPKMANKNCNFKISSGERCPGVTLTSLNTKLDLFIEEQRQFNKTLLNRIDNLVTKNNLKE